MLTEGECGPRSARSGEEANGKFLSLGYLHQEPLAFFALPRFTDFHRTVTAAVAYIVAPRGGTRLRRALQTEKMKLRKQRS